MSSLRRRAITGAAVWTALAVTLAGLALLGVFNDLAERRFNAGLETRHRQAVVALANSFGDGAALESFLTDPDYARPLSGVYWQIEAPDGEVFASRSLFDELLTLPGDPPLEPVLWSGEGPGGPLRGVVQSVTLEDAPGWTVAVAQSLDSLSAERRQTRRSVTAAFAVAGILGLLGGLVQVTLALRPIRQLRADVATRWEHGETLDAAAYPEEVAPLVGDINLLMGRNREVLDSARRQAADLAHALKTPVAVLRNEIERRPRKTAGDEAAREALDRIDAQILRSLARIRAGHAAASGHRTEVATSADRLARLFARTRRGAPAVEVDVPEDLTVGMDRQDLEEVLGNLIENAMAWRRAHVRLTARPDGKDVVIAVEDDGPGIPEERHAEVLRPGGRLDTSAPGSGLGLAIASDLVSAYGGTIALGTAPDLGGLRVALTLPMRHGPLEPLAAPA